jgi:hypothetical protein
MLAAGLFIFSDNLAWAQELPANILPEGTFASEDGCNKLAAKTPAELGEDLDFEILTKKGHLAYQQACDSMFIPMTRRAGSRRLLR